MTGQSWAEAEFGGAKLGNRLRVRRAVSMASRCTERAAGKVTEVFQSTAEREGAFRFIENGAIDAEQLMAAAHAAGARRCAAAAFAYVPVDKTSLNLTDTEGKKNFGMVGSRKDQAHGLQVMTAISVTPDGVPQGIVAQKYWGRDRDRNEGVSKKQRVRRAVEDTETGRWLDVMKETVEHFATQAPGTRPWFQVDREGDNASLLRWAIDGKHLITVRANWNRRVRSDAQMQQYLQPTLQAQPPLGRYQVEVSAGWKRQARRAVMEVRVAHVELELPRPRSTSRRSPAAITVVLAREVSEVPGGEEPLEWTLLTTHPVSNFQEACEVLYGYTQRWRIEDFHKTWKSGACRVEDNQLRAADHVIRWAVLLASVALRISRITHLARQDAHQPAATEFSANEIKVLRLLAKPKSPSATPTLYEVVRWLAAVGGYVGPSSGGPPGALVLARGLARIQSALDLLSAMGDEA